MEVRKLTLQQFRNYESCSLEFCPGVNVITGENGQGKTTLLEAIFLCTCARSHKTSKDKELIHYDTSEYKVELEFVANPSLNDFSETLEIGYYEAIAGYAERSRNTRIIKYNGVKLDRVAEMMGLFNAVIFAPEDIMLIKEGPQGRRRFLDLLISQVNRHYFSSLQLYGSVLLQRNRLLKLMKERGGAGQDEHLARQLSVWNEQLITHASEIILQRLKYAAMLAKHAANFHNQISSGSENMLLRYETLSGLTAESSLEDIANRYGEILLRHESEDIFRGSTSVGPHRDDISLKMDGKSLRSFGSQGQQRTAVLSLKLAELELLKEFTGQTPVLLLDDVLPELDENRRLSLVNSLKDAQVFITCTDIDEVHEKLRSLLADKGSRTYIVSNNQVTAV